MTDLKKTKIIRQSAVKLMLAGEELFAKRGIEATSLREIARYSGAKNTNAVTYHFESKENLIKEIHNYRVMQMEPMREKLLSDYEKSGEISELMRALTYPTLMFRNENGLHTFVHFHADYLSRLNAMGISHPFEDERISSPSLFKMSKYILNLMPEMPIYMKKERSMVANLMFFNLVMRSECNGISEDGARFIQAIEDIIAGMAAYIISDFRKVDESIIRKYQGI